MKIRNGFVANSSSSSYVVTNDSDTHILFLDLFCQVADAVIARANKHASQEHRITKEEWFAYLEQTGIGHFSLPPNSTEYIAALDDSDIPDMTIIYALEKIEEKYEYIHVEQHRNSPDGTTKKDYPGISWKDYIRLLEMRNKLEMIQNQCYHDLRTGGTFKVVEFPTGIRITRKPVEEERTEE